MSVSDERLMAYLDGELNAVDRARIDEQLAADAELRGRLEIQRQVRERLAARYDPIAQEPVPEPLRRMLETNVVPLAAAKRPAPAPRPWWQMAAALAATLVLGLVIGRSAMVDRGPIAIERGTAVAHDDLARALDTQLASNQPTDADYRIGVTFARGDGQYCRMFEGAALTGLACRGEFGWQVVLAAGSTAPSQSEYRQAASGNAQVMQAAQELMAGETLDAVAERRARDTGWQKTARAD